jgi:type I restriction enzyme S subunit
MLKGYREYKETNASWLPSIPKNWITYKIGELFEERRVKVSDKEYAPLTVGKMGVVPQLSTVAKSNDGDNRKLVKLGDYVINSRSDRRGSSGLSYYDGSVSLINIVLTPRKGNNRYYHYLLRSHYWIEEYYRNGRGIVADLWTTRFSEMKSIVLPIPPLSEQDQIVRYLDCKISMINKYINVKKKQIELLREQKQIIINEAVTRGGKNWKEIPLRKFLTPVSERNRADLPLLSVVREQGVILRDISNYEDNHNFIPDDLSNYKVVHTGQFVMNKMKAWQGSYGVSTYNGIVSPAYYVFNLDCDYMDFFHIAIRSRYYINKFAQNSIGIRIGQWDLPVDRIKEIRFLLPPLTEQYTIVECINKQCEYINIAIRLLDSEIVLFTEYRTRLISDVVTGRVDVQDVKVPEFAIKNECSLGVDQETEGDFDEE